MTLHDCAYENVKLQFVADLRQRIKNMQRELADGSTALPVDDLDSKTFKEILGGELYYIFIKLSEFLSNCLDSSFIQEDATSVNWDWMRTKFVDLTKFILEIFEPTSQVIDDAIKMNDYRQLLARFDKEVVRSFLQLT